MFVLPSRRATVNFEQPADFLFFLCPCQLATIHFSSIRPPKIDQTETLRSAFYAPQHGELGEWSALHEDIAGGDRSVLPAGVVEAIIK